MHVAQCLTSSSLPKNYCNRVGSLNDDNKLTDAIQKNIMRLTVHLAGAARVNTSVLRETGRVLT